MRKRQRTTPKHITSMDEYPILDLLPGYINDDTQEGRNLYEWYHFISNMPKSKNNSSCSSLGYRLSSIEEAIRITPNLYKKYYNINVTKDDIKERPYLVPLVFKLLNNRHTSSKLEKLILYDHKMLLRLSNIYFKEISDMIIIVLNNMTVRSRFVSESPFQYTLDNMMFHKGEIRNYYEAKWGPIPNNCKYLVSDVYPYQLSIPITRLTLSDTITKRTVLPKTLTYFFMIGKLDNNVILPNTLEYLNVSVMSSDVRLPSSLINLDCTFINQGVILPEKLKTLRTKDNSILKLPVSLTALSLMSLTNDISHLINLKTLKFSNIDTNVSERLPLSIEVIFADVLNVDLNYLTNLKALICKSYTIENNNVVYLGTNSYQKVPINVKYYESDNSNSNMVIPNQLLYLYMNSMSYDTDYKNIKVLNTFSSGTLTFNL